MKELFCFFKWGKSSMSERKYDISRDSISIGQFVSQYLEIDADCSNLRHMGLRSFNSPLVVGVSNDYANKNPELVKKGFLIIVLDCKRHKGTYINPIKLKELMDRDIVLDELKEIENIRINNLQDIQKYYQKYTIALQRLRELENFYQLLESFNKTDAVEKIKKQSQLFDRLYMCNEKENPNDKHKK